MSEPLYVACRVYKDPDQSSEVYFKKKGGIPFVSDYETVKETAGSKWHIYEILSPEHLSLVFGSFDSDHPGPQEVKVPKRHRDRLKQAVIQAAPKKSTSWICEVDGTVLDSEEQCRSHYEETGASWFVGPDGECKDFAHENALRDV